MTVDDAAVIRRALLAVVADACHAYAVEAYADADDYAKRTTAVLLARMTVEGTIDRWIAHWLQVH